MYPLGQSLLVEHGTPPPSVAPASPAPESSPIPESAVAPPSTPVSTICAASVPASTPGYPTEKTSPHPPDAKARRIAADNATACLNDFIAATS
jgi:hypothetical protein